MVREEVVAAAREEGPSWTCTTRRSTLASRLPPVGQSRKRDLAIIGLASATAGSALPPQFQAFNSNVCLLFVISVAVAST
jgi:hypothetical protein